MPWFDGVHENFSLTFKSDVFELTRVHVDIDGNTADAKASADAYGDDTFTAAVALTYTDDNESHSDAASFSATDNPDYRKPDNHKYY